MQPLQPLAGNQVQQDQVYCVALRDEFLGFYMNENWSMQDGLPQSILDDFDSKGEVEVDFETDVEIYFIKMIQRKLNNSKPLDSADTRDEETFNKEYDDGVEKIFE